MTVGKHDALLNKLANDTADAVDTLVLVTVTRIVAEGGVTKDSQASLTGLLWAAIREKAQRCLANVDQELEGHGRRRG